METCKSREQRVSPMLAVPVLISGPSVAACRCQANCHVSGVQCANDPQGGAAEYTTGQTVSPAPDTEMGFSR